MLNRDIELQTLTTMLSGLGRIAVCQCGHYTTVHVSYQDENGATVGYFKCDACPSHAPIGHTVLPPHDEPHAPLARRHRALLTGESR